MHTYLNAAVLIALLTLTVSCGDDPTEPDDDCKQIDTTTVIDDLCFERDVLPILQNSCATSGCHDAATASHEIVLDSWESIMNSDEDLVKPFDPCDSELYEVLVEDDEDERMPPPPMALTERQIGIIRQWIQEGALNEECGSASECDTKDVLWPTVQIILQDNCLGCHANDIALGDVKLEDPFDVQEQIENGLLISSILRVSGAAAMPPFSALDSCSIEIITAWRDQGFRR